MIYRVILKVGYCEAHFDFKYGVDACAFATTAINQMTPNEDNDRKQSIKIEVIPEEVEE